VLRSLFQRLRPAKTREESADDALARARDLGNAGDWAGALAIWHPLAQRGIPRAQAYVGVCLVHGLGTEAAPEAGARWLTVAAEAGDAVGQRHLAEACLKGNGTAQDDDAALRWYRAAAEAGDADSQDMLSWMLAEAGRDPAEAHRWALAAARQGIAAAMTRLGMFHHNAIGVPRDPAAAVRWWQAAAERGDADAQAMLGAAMLTGAGVARNRIEALAWLYRAMIADSALAKPFQVAARDGLTRSQQEEAERRARLPLPAPGAIPGEAP
jgi:TPR repeat protein